MKNKLIFLIFFVICLIGVSVYADICCLGYTQDERCKDKDDCQETSCGPNMVFNKAPEVCKCECGGEQSCGENKTWSKDSCSCECSGEQSCGENQTWDSEQCKCVCAETSCAGGKTQNKDTCACECPDGKTEVSNGQCCAPENVAEGYGGIKTCCQGTDPHTQGTPQCCTKVGGHWLSQTDSGGSDGRCCAADESAYDDNGQLGCCKNCCVKDSNGKPTPFAAGVQGGSSTGRVDPACCEAAGGEYASDTTGTFYGGVCCKGSKDIAHDNKLIKTCCTKAGGSIKGTGESQKCCKCPSGGC